MDRFEDDDNACHSQYFNVWLTLSSKGKMGSTVKDIATICSIDVVCV